MICIIYQKLSANISTYIYTLWYSITNNILVVEFIADLK